jgi:prepilin-type N-terminal cleavage/methylation domain-containing protein
MDRAQRTMLVPAMNKRSKGFTLFELILVIIVVALTAGMLFGRVLDYQEIAEKTAMEQTAGTLRSALALQISGLLARGKGEDLAKLAAVNPIALLAEVPQNYVGEYYGAAEDVAAGNWYFDLKSRQLVYLVRHGEHFQAGADGAKAVRYQVTPVYNDWMRETGAASSGKELAGLVLKELQPYSWNVK